MDGHKDVAKQVALESIVLLKNENRFLPLDRSALKAIAVIGPRANEVLLDWYSGTPPIPSRRSTASRRKLAPA